MIENKEMLDYPHNWNIMGLEVEDGAEERKGKQAIWLPLDSMSMVLSGLELISFFLSLCISFSATGGCHSWHQFKKTNLPVLD